MGIIWGSVQGKFLVWVHQGPNIIWGRHQALPPRNGSNGRICVSCFTQQLLLPGHRRDLCSTGICSGAEPHLQAPEKREESVFHSQITGNTERHRDSLAWDRAGIRNRNQGKKPATKLPCYVFLSKYHQGLSLSPQPSLSPHSQGVWTQHSQNGIFCLMVCSGKNFSRLGALEMMLHIPS